MKAGAEFVGTLLSPEGAEVVALRRFCMYTHASDVEHVRPPRSSNCATRRQAMNRRDGRPYLENCTVDASIFVAKLIRAHGGCLGTRSR